MPTRVPKHNLAALCQACSDGDLELVQMMLDRKDRIHGFQGDLNQHHKAYTALHFAAVNGQLECVQALLKAEADPHVRTRMPHGQDPADGRTAAELADDWGWDDVVAALKVTEDDIPKGDYVAGGPLNNAKIYPSHEITVTGLNFSGPLRRFFREQHELQPHVGLLFPGQGSQHVGMLSQAMELPAMAEMLRIAKHNLNWDPAEVCTRGPASKLDSVTVAYPALYIAGAAGLEMLRQRSPGTSSRPGAVAGLGIGEYTALLAAEVVSFEDGLKLVKALAEAVREAVERTPQALLSVAGLRRSKLEGFCKSVEAEAGKGAVCAVANELFPKGATCGGTRTCMERLEQLAKAQGALQVKLVQCGAVHTPLMADAVPALSAALDEIGPRMKPPTCDIYMNSTGRAIFAGTSPKELIPLLVRQLTEPVLWEQCVKSMIKGGVCDFYELGPRMQLKAMMKRIDAGAFERMKNIEV